MFVYSLCRLDITADSSTAMAVFGYIKRKILIINTHFIS